MSGPWKKYQAVEPTPMADGPWSKYQAPEQSDIQDVEPSTPMPSRGRTALDQSLQGATFGFGDEVMDGIGAVGAKLYDMTLGDGVLDGQSVGDVYDDARKASSERLTNQIEQRPALSIASNIVGGLGTFGAAGTTKAGSALANSLRTGGTGARVAKGVAAGSTSGATYGYGTGEGSIENRIDTAGEGAVLGGAVGGAIPAVGAAARGAVNKVKGKASILNSDEIKAMSQKAYQTAARKGGMLKPNITNKFVDSIEELKPQTKLGKVVAGGDDKVTELVDRVKQIRDNPISLDEAQEIDELLGDMVDNFVENGYVSKQGKKVLELQGRFRQAIEETTENDVVGGKAGFEALKEGRGLWSKMTKMRDIEKIIQRAEMMDNPATGIKTGFRTLASNPKRMKGFSKEEQKLIRQAADTGVVTDLLRTAGSRLLPIVSAGAGDLTGAAGMAAGSMASRGAATRLQLNRAGNVARSISDSVKGQTGQLPALPIARTPLLSAPAGGAAAIQHKPDGTPYVRPNYSASQNDLGGSQGNDIDLPAEDYGMRIPPAELPTAPAQQAADEQPEASNFLTRVAMAESGGDPNAKAPTSSASGLYQFTDGTWRSMVQKYGRKHRIGVKDKNDPEAQHVMARLLTKENERSLSQALKRKPTEGELYVAHFAGAADAKKLLKASPRSIAAKVLPKAAKSNPNIFYDNNRARTTGEVVELLKSKVS